MTFLLELELLTDLEGLVKINLRREHDFLCVATAVMGGETTVPEPATLLLLVIGGMVMLRRKRK